MSLSSTVRCGKRVGNAFRKIYEKISYAKCATYPGCTGYQANRKAGFPVWPEIGYPAGFLDIFFAYNKVFLAGYRIFDQIPDIWPYVNCLPKLTDLYLQHRFWCVVSYRCGPPAENRSRYAPRPPPLPQSNRDSLHYNYLSKTTII